MKKALIIFVVAVIFLGILGAVLFKVFAPSSSSQVPQQTANLPMVQQTPTATNVQGPDGLASSCYKWYISYFANTSSKPSETDYQNGVNACFTSEFINSWPSGENVDMDPVLLSQDYQNSWVDSVRTTVLASSVTTGSVLIQLGTGSTEKDLLLTLEKTSLGWRISNVAKK